MAAGQAGPGAQYDDGYGWYRLLFGELNLLLMSVCHLLVQHYNIHNVHQYGQAQPLVVFLCILLAKRLAWALCREDIRHVLSDRPPTLTFVLKLIVLSVPLGMLGRTGVMLMYQGQDHLLQTLFPLGIYLSLFGPRVDHTLFRVLPASSDKPEAVMLSQLYTLASILYISFEAAYFAAVVPMLSHKDPNGYMDSVRSVSIAVFTFSNTFFFWSTRTIEARWQTLLHQANTLGHWVPTKKPTNAKWSKQAWPAGSIVKYRKKVYRAVGHMNSAQPGDKLAGVFFHIFGFPERVLRVLIVLEAVSILAQFLFLLLGNPRHAAIIWGTLGVFGYKLVFETIMVRRYVHRMLRGAPPPDPGAAPPPPAAASIGGPGTATLT